MPNQVRIEGAVAVLTMRTGEEVKVDVGDLGLVSPYTWHRAGRPPKHWYATATIANRSVQMHRLIMDAPDGLQVDHINHDTLDNRRVNLRLLNNAQNNQNRAGAYRNNATGVRGVRVVTIGGLLKFRPSVMLNGVANYGPYFPYCKQGLKDAAQWLFDKRRELMPYSSHDHPFVPAEVLDALPDVPQARRFATGSAHGMAKRTPDEVREIRRLAREGVKQTEIARRFGISSGGVSRIVNRIDWAHLEDEP